MKKDVFARLLRATAKAVDRMTLEEVEDLIALLESKKTPLKKNLKNTPRQTIDQIAMQRLLASLSQASSRSEGQNLLSEFKLARRDLELLAKAGNVHVTKEDSMQSIEQKVIEALIGSRLNSIAIRGK